MGKPRNTKRNRNTQRSKEVEVDVARDRINRADLPHTVTTAMKNNDPSWYGHIYPVVNDVASLPFNQQTGLYENVMPDSVNMAVEAGYNHKVQFDMTSRSIPGIMTFSVDPLVVANGPTDPINVAAQQMYTLTRKANSGAINYDKTDLIMLVQAMDSAYMLYEDLLRVYRLFGSYDYMNRYLPDAVIAALGYSPSLRKQLSNFRGVLDMFAYQLASINIPDQFDFIHRHSWLFTNVYKDADNSRAQLYAYKMNGLYVWTEGVGDQPTHLEHVSRNTLFRQNQTPSYVSSLDDIQHAIDRVMQPLLGSQDVGTISGDLAKAFGDAGMINIRPVADHESLFPVYDMEVINQMMNASIAPFVNFGNVNANYEDTTSGPYIEAHAYTPDVDFSTTHNYLLNYHGLEPTPEMNLVATRFMYVASSKLESIPWGTGVGRRILSAGTEIISDCRVWVFDTNSQGIIDVDNPGDWELEQHVILSKTPESDFLHNNISMLTMFDNHPTVYMYAQIGEAPNITDELRGYLQDIDNHVWLTADDVVRLNQCAVLSEYAVKDYKTGFTK